MEREELLALLKSVRTGDMPPEEAAGLLARSGFEDLGYARVDHSRARRQGAAEVIFGQGKTAEQIEGIVQSMIGRGTGNIIITRLSEEKEAALRGKFTYRYSREAHLAVANPVERPLRGSIAVVSAGTSDLAVCEEAALTAEALGSKVHRVYDAGVAGAHRPPAELAPLEAGPGGGAGGGGGGAGRTGAKRSSRGWPICAAGWRTGTSAPTAPSSWGICCSSR